MTTLPEKPEAKHEPREPAKSIAVSGQAPKYVIPLDHTVVFVYGTLKKKGKLHAWMDNSTYLCDGVAAGYTLLSLGQFPAMVGVEAKQGEKLLPVFKTAGELYAIPDDEFASLSVMERRVGYSEETITVLVDGTYEKQAKAFVFGAIKMGTSEWRSYEVEETKDVIGLVAVA